MDISFISKDMNGHIVHSKEANAYIQPPGEKKSNAIVVAIPIFQE